MTLHSESAIKPLDALLAGYCIGSLEPATHALVASHLLLKPDSRPFVAALEKIAAGAMEAGAPAPLTDRDGRLSAIFMSPEPARPAASVAAAVDPRLPSLPAPLTRLVGRDFSAIKWRTKLPGVREFRVCDNGRGEASLLWIRAGRRMPSHTHEGSEVILVLNGGFSDITGHYGRGDVAVADAELDHRPMTDEDGDCLCFAVTDAPLHLTGPVGRLLERFFGPRP